MAMTAEERAEYQRLIAENESRMLDRIEYHGRKLIEEGREPVTSPNWIAFHRRRLEKQLGERNSH